VHLCNLPMDGALKIIGVVKLDGCGTRVLFQRFVLKINNCLESVILLENQGTFRTSGSSSDFQMFIRITPRDW